MEKLEVRHLKLVKTIAETGTVTKAAGKLNITQPALSRQLSDIEYRLETPLFTRTKKKMILTKSGEKIFEAADRVLKELSRVELDIEKSIHGETGILKIGVHCILCYKWLPALMKRFQKSFPKVDLEIKNSERYIADLTSESVGMVITSFPVINAGVHYENLFQDELVIVMNPGHPLGEKKKLVEKDFQGVRMIAFTEKSKDGFYRFFLEPAGVEPPMFMKVQQPEAVMELVKEGFGVAMLPRWAVKNYLDKGELTASGFAGADMSMGWKAATLNSKEQPLYQREFIRMIKGQGFIKGLNKGFTDIAKNYS